MSFDPQPIRLKGYTSTYVDPKYDVMLESLNKRYETNYAANDALEAQLLQLESAPFDSDRAERIKVIKDTQKKLQEYADRGDFENLSISLARTGKEYAKATAPITANAKAYSAYKSSLDEMVKNNDIDAGTKNKLLGYSAANYKGFSRDETGMVDPNSMFMGVGAVKDPKVLDMLDTHLAKIVADGDKSRIKRVDQVQYDANGNPLPGRYEVLTESGWERVSEQDVLNSFGVVMNEPKVTSYLNQQAVLNTYDMTPDKLNNWAQTTFDSYSKMKQSLEEKKTKLESEAGSILQKDPSTLNATQQQAIAAYNNINSQLSEVDKRMSQFKGAAGNEEALRNMAIKGWYEDKYKEYQQYATNTFAYDKVTANTSEITWDSAYLKEVENAAKTGTAVGAEVITEMPVIELDPTTNTYTASNEFIKSTESELKKLETQLQEDNARPANNKLLSTSLRNDLESKKRNLQSNLDFEKERLRRAAKLANIDDISNLDGALIDNSPVNIGVDKDTKKDVFISRAEFLDTYLKNNYNSGETIRSLQKSKNIVVSEGQVISSGRRAVDFTSADATQFIIKLNSSVQNSNKNGKDPLTGIYQSLNEDKLAQIQKILSESSKTAITMSNIFPGRDERERKANTTAIRNYFTNGIPTNLPVYVQGQNINETSNISSLIENGVVPTEYKVDVNKISINNESGSIGSTFGEDVVVIPITDKDGNALNPIFVPANSVYTPTMKQALNSSFNRFSRIMTRAATLPALKGEDNYYTHSIMSTNEKFSGPMDFQINPESKRVRVIWNGTISPWYSPNDPDFKDLFLDRKGIGDKF